MDIAESLADIDAEAEPENDALLADEEGHIDETLTDTDAEENPQKYNDYKKPGNGTYSEAKAFAYAMNTYL